uniref:Uncharacterized protein n=1 Tax=Anser brachyrhynchus TaxID=132585 RepID=A0A8B9CLI6_9AVES
MYLEFLRKIFNYSISTVHLVKASIAKTKQGYDWLPGDRRILHQSVEKTIHVHKFVMGFGRGNHLVPTEKLKAKYPD